ncbi:hypothetical protein L1280_000198 [Deinococcus sp. HSC-46F16]|nr:hypothetical protein [Deinococcus sp. HSC-46F16]
MGFGLPFSVALTVVLVCGVVFLDWGLLWSP